jgi:predicted metal-dependent peptidase
VDTLIFDTSGSMSDISGSMSNDIRNRIASYFKKQKKIRVIQCDDRTHSNRVVTVKEIPMMVLHGRGGSDLRPAIKLAKGKVYIVTDGFFYFPLKTKRIVWLIPREFLSPQISESITAVQII